MANMAMSAPHATPCADLSSDVRIAAATPATAVPWEKRSPVSSVAEPINTSVTVLPAKSGWPWSIPESMNPMVTPAPGAAAVPLS